MKSKCLLRCYSVLFIIFLFLSLNSHSQILNCDVFNISSLNFVDDSTEIKDYVVKKDGEKIYYKEFSWKRGVLSKDVFIVDNHKYKLSEIKGYQADKIFWHWIKNDYIRRIIHGKINIYYNRSEETTSSVSVIKNQQYSACLYYAQKGDNGEIVRLTKFSDIEELVKDCPAAYQMLLNIDIKKELKQDPRYMNKVFALYNSSCK